VTTVYVVHCPEGEESIFVFDTPEAAEAFRQVKGEYISSEPILDMSFALEAAAMEETE
jgi:hypothetical protein